jgi:hypothetical protein
MSRPYRRASESDRSANRAHMSTGADPHRGPARERLLAAHPGDQCLGVSGLRGAYVQQGVVPVVATLLDRAGQALAGHIPRAHSQLLRAHDHNSALEGGRSRGIGA